MTELTYEQRRAVEHTIAMFVSQHQRLFDKQLIFSKLALALDRAIVECDGTMPDTNGRCGGAASGPYPHVVSGGGGRGAGPTFYAGGAGGSFYAGGPTAGSFSREPLP